MAGHYRWTGHYARWTLANLLGGTLLGIVALSGCGAGEASGSPSHAQSPGAPSGANIALRPGNGVSDANPAGPIQAAVTNGTISSVALTNANGGAVAGQLSADRHTWTATEDLGYGKTYTWSGSAIGPGGVSVPITGSFTTLTPKQQISGQLNVGDAQTYGVAMPIVLHFSAPVADEASVQKALSVRTSVPIEGAWAWLDSQDVHWRPKTYYQPGTFVTVTAMLYGRDFGAGAYGSADLSASFVIGRSQVVQGNVQTHHMVVITNGIVTADYPASFGLDSDPGRNTHSGVHVVMSKSQDYSMSNPSYGYTNVLVHWAVRISNNGEFVHAAPWSVSEQGYSNVSHGCVNLSTENALAYYNSVLVGDPVEITGSPIPLGPSDGDFYDWTLSWDQWRAKSAGV